MPRGHRTAEWLLRRSRWVIASAILSTAALAFPMLAMAPDTTASQNPGGEVIEVQDLVTDRFVSDVYGAGFIVEPRDGNALTREALFELFQNVSAVRADPEISDKLFSYYAPEIRTEVSGIYTIADAVDGRLRDAGVDGLAAADDGQVVETVAALLQDSEPSMWGLLPGSGFDEASGRWVAPALMVSLVAQNELLGGGGQAITLGDDNTLKEQFARDAQTLLRGDERTYQVWGIAIDVGLTVSEQAAAAGPFIGFTVLAVLVVAGLILRSYWAVAVLGAALGALMIWLKGISNLIGLENDQILSFIVPIAMISFGVDFAFHAVGRYREEAADGHRPRAAFVIGMGGVLAALVLALASDSVAFLSNVSAGIESIIQFGIGASIALIAAFLILGLVSPMVLMLIDDALGSRPVRGFRRIGREMASGLAATAAMAVVLFLVYILPVAGVGLWAFYLLAFLAFPFAVARRRRAPEADLATPSRLRGRLIGKGAAAVARRRMVVLPALFLLWAAAILVAVQIEPRFDVKDFFAADADFVVSLDKLDEHVGQQGGEPADIYVEGNLADPRSLTALAAFRERVQALDVAELAIGPSGATEISQGVLGVIEDVMETPFAVGAIGAVTGTELSDANGDGLPDTPDQIAALYSFTSQAGIPLDSNRLVRTPDSVGLSLWQDDARQATVLTLGVVGSRSQENVAAAREALEPLVDNLQAELQAVDPGARAVLTGSAVVRHEQLKAIMRALVVSLPISVIACLIIAALFMRSMRLGLVSVVPILVVVAWLYAFMHLAGYGINIVTATIGAVSIGIGIDFAIHFIMRYREELERLRDRLEAVEAAGAGTGAALAASALSSVVGFSIMALAPMPMFADYGFLTAIMIVMALLATLAVLPGLLMLVTAAEPVPQPPPIPTPLETAGAGGARTD